MSKKEIEPSTNMIPTRHARPNVSDQRDFHT
jgi:hypothetical protein